MFSSMWLLIVAVAVLLVARAIRDWREVSDICAKIAAVGEINKLGLDEMTGNGRMSEEEFRR